MFNFIKQLFGYKEKFGLVRDPSFEDDPRNIRYEVLSGALEWEKPPITDVETSTVTFNQGGTSSCTCQGACALFDDKEGHTLSPRYAFKMIRTSPDYGSSRLQWGAYMADPFRLKVNEGICEYILAPNYDTGTDDAFLKLSISPEMTSNASKYKGGTYVTIAQFGSDTDQFDEIVKYMALENSPLVTSVLWDTGWNRYARTDGIIPNKKWTGKQVWHIMKACHYKWINGHEYIGFRNSYGAKYGGTGITWLPRGVTLGMSIGFIPKEKEITFEIEKPAKVQKEDVVRNIHKERANVQELEAFMKNKFPLDVPDPKANKKAWAYFESKKLILNWGVCYNGYSFEDVINHIYAVSRNKVEELAYKIDFTQKRESQIT